MSKEIDIAALRKAAQEAAWTGRWYDGGCNTVFCDYNGKPGPEHDEIAHPCPLGITEFLASVNPPAILDLLDRLEKAERYVSVQDAEVTPEMLKAAQMKSDLGGWFCANWVGAYDCITELYQVMAKAQEPTLGLAALLDRLERAEKDAARYREWQKRFLKDSDTKERTYTDALLKADTPEKVDAVLDAAMQGEGA